MRKGKMSIDNAAAAAAAADDEGSGFKVRDPNNYPNETNERF